MAAKIIIAIFALINVIFVPIYDVWGGLFPDDPQMNFFSALGAAAEGDFYDGVILTLIIFIPTLLMFFTPFIESNVPYKTFASLGLAASLILTTILIFSHADLYGHIKYAIAPEETSICIGTWIAVFLFFLGIVAVPAPEDDDEDEEDDLTNAQVIYVPYQVPLNNYQQTPQNPVYGNYPPPVQNNNYYNQAQPTSPDIYYRCQKCNSLVEPNQAFCPNCGTPKAI